MTASLGSDVVPVELEEVDVEVVVNDLSMVLSCSKSSFMAETSDIVSSSFSLELVEDESSPSTF